MAAVSTQATNSQDNPLAGFGPNEWIVEEMYQRYLADPASVDPGLARLLRRLQAGAAADGADAGQPAAARRARRRPGQPAPADAGDGHQAGRPGRPGRRRARGRARSRPAKAAPGEDRAGATAAAPVAHDHARCAASPPRSSQNMDASLEVPTATSVRAVPAKLLADNRIVINNHLARGRGGKVSFTHLIGYALVRALAAHPEMNNSFAEVDGKPVAGQPGARQPRHRDRPGQAGRLPQPGGAQHQGLRARWTSGSSGRPTRTSSGGPGATS